MTWQEALKGWIQKNGLTYKAFADRIGTSSQNISTILSGKSEGSYNLRKKIFEVTNGDVDCIEYVVQAKSDDRVITLDQTTIKMLHYLSLMEPDGVRSLIEALYNKMVEHKLEAPDLSPACRLLWMHMQSD